MRHLLFVDIIVVDWLPTRLAAVLLLWHTAALLLMRATGPGHQVTVLMVHVTLTHTTLALSAAVSLLLIWPWGIRALSPRVRLGLHLPGLLRRRRRLREYLGVGSGGLAA